MKEDFLFKIRMQMFNDFISLGVCFPKSDDEKNLPNEEIVNLNVARVENFFNNENVEIICQEKFNDFKKNLSIAKMKYLIKDRINKTSKKKSAIGSLSNYFMVVAVEKNLQNYSEYLKELVWKDLNLFLADYIKSI